MLAAIADEAERLSKIRFPGMAERCKSCAFRAGTLPNGCPDTVWDALKCVVEMRDFSCHQHFDENGKPIDICVGWLLAVSNHAPQLPQAIKDYVADKPYSDALADTESAL